jgi:CheY-like chemotaxis protein
MRSATSGNLLIIDDDSDYRKILRGLAEGEGYRVIERESGSRVDPELCRICSLVVLDMVMPDSEGIETLIRLRREGVTTKILAISGAGRGSEYLQIARTLGADGVAHKQDSHRDLVRAIHRLAGDTKSERGDS